MQYAKNYTFSRSRLFAIITILTLACTMAMSFAMVRSAHAATPAEACDSTPRKDVSVTWGTISMIATTPNRVVGQGNAGACVKAIQQTLNLYCTKPISADGIYGPKTAKAVKAFQNYARHGFNNGQPVRVSGQVVSADGVVGRQTFALFTLSISVYAENMPDFKFNCQ